jgi:hypothetical protein
VDGRPPGRTVVAVDDDGAVVETNERAVALWQSLGFEIVGTVPEAFRPPSMATSACT